MSDILGFAGSWTDPPRGKRWNYIRYDWPDASLAAAATEEIEIETGMSIADRQAIIFGGAFTDGAGFVVAQDQESEVDSAIDHLQLTYQTRSGDFDLDDPELLARYRWIPVVAHGTGETGLDSHVDHIPPPPGGEMFVSPVLVSRVFNDGLTTISANTLQSRVAYEFDTIGTNLLIELLEKHADVFII